LVTAAPKPGSVKRKPVAKVEEAAPVKKSRTVKVTPKAAPVVTPEVEEETEIQEPEEVRGEEVAASEDSETVETPNLKRKDVAPRPFRSEMVDIYLIDGYDNGDPPDDDFIADISTNGIEVPPRVNKEGDRYVVVDGRRRLKAADHLVQTGRKEFAKLPVIIDTRKLARDPRFASLAMNYQRGENIVGDARTVMGLKGEGYTEKQIAGISGLKIEQVRALRKIMTQLDPRLVKLVEEGRMKSWAARQAAQKAPEVQARLVKLAETKDIITPEDVNDAHRANVIQTANGMENGDLYDGEEFPFEESEEAAAPAVGSAPVQSPTASAKKVSHEQRVENAIRYATFAKQELLQIKTNARTSAEQAALDSFEDALRLLSMGEDVVEDVSGDEDDPAVETVDDVDEFDEEEEAAEEPESDEEESEEEEIDFEDDEDQTDDEEETEEEPPF
jgi:ParB-like chromosome segregation protein Spo0J